LQAADPLERSERPDANAAVDNATAPQDAAVVVPKAGEGVTCNRQHWPMRTTVSTPSGGGSVDVGKAALPSSMIALTWAKNVGGASRWPTARTVAASGRRRQKGEGVFFFFFFLIFLLLFVFFKPCDFRNQG
jgi:hypothetical protein